MKRYAVIAILCITPLTSSWADQSDKEMPAVVAEATTKVDVLMDYIKTTAQCFPDPDAKVRWIGGRVVLEDFKAYKNRKPRMSEGLVAFKLKDKWGACDGTGKVIIPARFDSGFEFHEALAGVGERGKYGFIDQEGKWIIKPTFDTNYTWDFIGGVCAVYVGGKGAVIDKKGAYVWKLGLLRSENLGGGIFIQTADGREGFLDDSGNLIPDSEPNRRYYKGK